MLELCKEYKVPVIMDSDAHVDTAVGNHQYPLEVIQMVDFPEATGGQYQCGTGEEFFELF